MLTFLTQYSYVTNYRQAARATVITADSPNRHSRARLQGTLPWEGLGISPPKLQPLLGTNCKECVGLYVEFFSRPGQVSEFGAVTLILYK